MKNGWVTCGAPLRTSLLCLGWRLALLGSLVGPCGVAGLGGVVALGGCGGSGEQQGGEVDAVVFGDAGIPSDARIPSDATVLPDDALPEHWQAGLAPGVNWGLAVDYLDDVGISDHPDVFAAEDFEAGEVTIITEEDRYAQNVTVVASEAYTGTYAGEHRWPEGLNGPTCRYPLSQDAHGGEMRPAYFLRMAFKFDPSFHPGDVSRGVGVKGFGIYCELGPSGVNVPCDGTNWYDAAVQFVGWGPSQKPEANDGYLWVGHLYSYNPYPDLAVAALGEILVSDPAVGDRPYRFSSYADPFWYLRFGDWHTYEVGLYLNTPEKRDGEARFWIDGILQSRVVGMGYRDVEALYPTSMHLNLHRTTESFPQDMVRWADNIVLARRYIGPVKLSE